MLARLWFHFLFAWLALVLPFMTWRRRAAYRRGAPAVKLDTRQLHARVIFGQWLAVLGLLLVCGRVGIPFAALGLTMPKLVPLAIAAAILAALGAWWVRTQERALANPEKVAKMRERFGGFSLLVPLTDAEQRSWILLSITAGVCEEVLYRGFMGFYLGQWMTLSTAAVLASLFFGAAHLYQGPQNAVKTALVGLIHWELYLVTGSIVPGMVLHALIDVRSGAVLRRAFTEPAPTAA